MSYYNVDVTSDLITISIFKQSVPGLENFYFFKAFVRKTTSSNAEDKSYSGYSNYISFDFDADPNTSYIIRVRYAASQEDFNNNNWYDLWYDDTHETITVTTDSAPAEPIKINSFSAQQTADDTLSITINVQTNIPFNNYSLLIDRQEVINTNVSGGPTTNFQTIWNVSEFGSHFVQIWVQDSTGDSNIYSNETPVNVYATIKATVQYDANGGSGAPGNTVKIDNRSLSVSGNVTVPLSSTIPTKEGAEFQNWLVDNKTSVNAGGNISLSASRQAGDMHQAVAQWEVNTNIFIWASKGDEAATWHPAIPYIYTNKWTPVTAEIHLGENGDSWSPSP